MRNCTAQRPKRENKEAGRFSAFSRKDLQGFEKSFTNLLTRSRGGGYNASENEFFMKYVGLLEADKKI